LKRTDIRQHISKTSKNYPYIYQLSCTTVFFHSHIPAPTHFSVC